MQRQKTLTVKGNKIKIVSRLVDCGRAVTTYVNGVRLHHTFEIMLDYDLKGITTEEGQLAFSEEFISRAMEKSYLKWVKKHAPALEEVPNESL